MDGYKHKPKSSSPLLKVYFELEEDWHGHITESLWAEFISGTRYRLRNTPYFAKNVSFLDVIFVLEKHGQLIYQSTSVASGHSTYRVLFDKHRSIGEFEKHWDPLEALGCTFETMTREETLLYAIDVPPSASIHETYQLLEQGAQSGIWDFEEGHCSHTIKPIP